MGMLYWLSIVGCGGMVGGGGGGARGWWLLFVGAKDSKDYDIDRPAKTGRRPCIFDSIIEQRAANVAFGKLLGIS